MSPKTKHDTPVDILKNTRDLLAFHKSIGIEEYPATDSIDNFLATKTATAKKDQSTAGPLKSSAPQDNTFDDIIEDLGDCTRCGLHEDRTHIVFGQGRTRSGLFIVGEWPSPEDDLQKTPFAGEAGDLLDKMLAAIGLDRDDAYLTHMIKCRPKNKVNEPQQEHITACKPFLLRQIAVAAPKVICAMGPLAAQSLLGTDQLLFKLRGRFHKLMDIPLMPTFHPAFLIKNPEMKKAAWIDLQMIQKKLG